MDIRHATRLGRRYGLAKYAPNLWDNISTAVLTHTFSFTVGGPDRPPSKRMILQARADQQQQRTANRTGTNASSSSAGADQEGEGYWAYMQRQISERTEKLGMAGDSMERLGEHSAGWADDVGKFVQRQKRNAVMGSEFCRICWVFSSLSFANWGD
jgi:syntaxin-binding protein 5